MILTCIRGGREHQAGSVPETDYTIWELDNIIRTQYYQLRAANELDRMSVFGRELILPMLQMYLRIADIQRNPQDYSAYRGIRAVHLAYEEIDVMVDPKRELLSLTAQKLELDLKSAELPLPTTSRAKSFCKVLVEYLTYELYGHHSKQGFAEILRQCEDLSGTETTEVFTSPQSPKSLADSVRRNATQSKVHLLPDQHIEREVLSAFVNNSQPATHLLDSLKNLIAYSYREEA
jgi:hypothetical protein